MRMDVKNVVLHHITYVTDDKKINHGIDSQKSDSSEK
jgi:hypothetical protein